MTERPPFSHAGQALRYLFNPERVSCNRPPASRMADKRKGEPGDLSGENGAATAATAEDMLKRRLTPLQLAVLACRYAPPKLRCDCRSDCCSGWRTNPAWGEAISHVAAEAAYQAMPGRETIDRRYAAAVLRRQFGGAKITLTDVGASLGMSLGSCTNYKRRIHDWLFRAKAIAEEKTQNGIMVKPALAVGVDVQAIAVAEEVLRSGGFIE